MDTGVNIKRRLLMNGKEKKAHLSKEQFYYQYLQNYDTIEQTGWYKTVTTNCVAVADIRLSCKQLLFAVRNRQQHLLVFTVLCKRLEDALYVHATCSSIVVQLSSTINVMCFTKY